MGLVLKQRVEVVLSGGSKRFSWAMLEALVDESSNEDIARVLKGSVL